jgi:hypothetical protein
VIKSRRIKWVGHVAHMSEERHKNLKWRELVGDLGKDGMGVDWNGSGQCLALMFMNAIMNLQDP